MSKETGNEEVEAKYRQFFQEGAPSLFVFDKEQRNGRHVSTSEVRKMLLNMGGNNQVARRNW